MLPADPENTGGLLSDDTQTQQVAPGMQDTGEPDATEQEGEQMTQVAAVIDGAEQHQHQQDRQHDALLGRAGYDVLRAG